MSDYPPTGLSEGVQKLPEVSLSYNLTGFISFTGKCNVKTVFQWIQKGCGDEEYYCEEKGATFTAASMPDKCPDLSEHK